MNRRAVLYVLVALACGCVSRPAPNFIRVSEVTLHGDMECFKIETPVATYFYGKRGAGFARILDRDGHDWISYHHGGKALGEYRGLPKCGQPVKYFHCGYGFGQYTNDNPFRSAAQVLAPGHVRVRSETRDDSAACEWDFFATHATMTLLRIPGHYWFLYEGTPGGQLDVNDDFVLRADGKRTPLREPWTEVVSWVCFQARESARSFFLINHQTNSPVDSYVAWPYQPEADGALNQMTVFGFGRPSWTDPKQHTPTLDQLPARFTIGFTDETNFLAVAGAITAIQRHVAVALSFR